jgi:hypothetical protein
LPTRSSSPTKTIDRVRRNLQTIAARLHDAGYEFATPRDVFVTADETAPKKIARLESLAGGLPLSLRAWYAAIGQVDLRGRHPRIKSGLLTDALVVYPVDVAIEEEFPEWSDDDERAHNFRVPIAPDALHKAGLSGGMWYGIELPNLGADALLLEEPHCVHFLRYLRIALGLCGLPGLEREADRPSFIREIGRDLIPF